MPELPEVEYVRRMLRPAMRGARIARVVARRPNLRYPLGDDFVARLEGQTVTAITRRAKYLVVALSSGETLVMHLGMSGWFRVVAAAARHRAAGELTTHDHVVFELSSGAMVVFNDPRRFGFMRLVPPGGTEPGVAALGPEPLDRAFTADVLARALKGRRTSLKAALLDQRVVAGLGNIYVSEALHRARLSPRRRAATLVDRHGAPRPSARALVDGIKAALRDAIANRHRADGDDRFLVYDHEGRRCPRRGCPGVITRIVQGARATYFCPVCQK